MYKIGELSKLCKLPVKTLRFYDSEGLLIPDEIDRFTGYRYYSAARLADCNRIMALKELGFTLDEIKAQLRSDKTTDIVAMIDIKIAELKDAVLHRQTQLLRLESIKEIISEGENVMYNVIIKDSELFNIAFTRNIFKNKEDAYDEITKIRSMLPQNILGSRSVIINNETEYTEADLDLVAGVEITGKLPVDCPYGSTSLKAAAYAALICRKECIEDAYSFMIRQLDTLSCQIIGAFIEIYYDDETVELKVPICQLSQSEDKIKFDSTDIPFVNDTDVVGKWTFLDIVSSRDQFLYGKPKFKNRDNISLKELYFLAGGEGYWIIHSWTKGSFATTSGDFPKQVFRNYYSIVKDNDKTLMFIEMKQYWLEKRGGQPVIYVFEKMSDKEFNRAEIQIKDNTDMPFITDENVIGNWIVRDFVREPVVFNASKQNRPEDHLFFKKVSFNSNGTATAIYGQNSPYEQIWTKGYLLDVRNSKAPAYHIENINGKDYLFVEWKSGDYTFGGRKPLWYVFVRE